jgi:exoribonuclease-2
MVNENALVVFKNKPALVREKTEDKIVILLPDGAQIKVREKDVELIHPGPVKDLNSINEPSAKGESGCRAFSSNAPDSVVCEAWELLLDTGVPVSLKELAELVCGEYNPVTAWFTYCLLLDSLYFSGTIDAIRPRLKEQVEADKKKREEKQRMNGERELFLERLRSRRPNLQPEGGPPDDRRYIQDVEALAFGRSDKSRTMKDIGLGETPEEAHALLLECGFWTEKINPYPDRFGVSLLPAKQIPGPPQAENRRDLSRLVAFAIDSPWSHDPDDAVSLEIDGGKQILYVHVADPAASIAMDSPPERDARDRGATLYLPEGSFRMLANEALPVFALGLAEISPALTFRMTLNSSGDIEETEIFPSTVKVSRLTYKEADRLMMNTDNSVHDTAMLCDLYTLAERNFKRRSRVGAINIDLPEIHIGLDQGEVTIEPIVPYRSADLVRECMHLAGEGAAIWAIHHNVPFPYIEQEEGEIPDEILPGVAGAYQLRRCMRPRTLSVKPGWHWGLGLNAYTQVTSPLRRYTDLLAHIQIRTFLRGEAPLPTDEAMARMSAAEAAAIAVTKAERASRSHWIMVYLSGKTDSVWEAIALEKKGHRWAVLIPALALETQVPLRKEIAPNDMLTLILKSVNIPKREAIFIVEE